MRNPEWLQFIKIVCYKIDKSNLYNFICFTFYSLELHFLYFYLTLIFYNLHSVFITACSIALA